MFCTWTVGNWLLFLVGAVAAIGLVRLVLGVAGVFVVAALKYLSEK